MPDTAILSVGEYFADRYLIREPLGEGGMGCVYEVFDELLSEFVALKVGRPGKTEEDQIYQDALKREVSLARKVTHPGVARIYDLGVDSGRLYMTMERIHGASLSQRLTEGVLTTYEATWMASQIASGLSAAHHADVIHGDLKPSNIMLCEGSAKKVVLLDFGVAKAMGTRGRGMGTPSYMSPEQLLDEPLSGASDVYALGLVIYQMLTGLLPFSARGQNAQAVAKIAGPPPRLPDTYPPALADFVQRMLQSDPDERPSAAEAVEQLCANGVHGAATTVSMAPLNLSRKRDVSSLPRNLGPRLAKGRRTLLHIGEENEILAASDEALAEEPNLDLALAMRAVALVRIRSRLEDIEFAGEDSAAAVATALSRAPHLPESHLADGVQAMNAGDFGYAVRAFRRALERAPLFLPAHQMLFRLEIEAGLPVLERQRLIESLDPQMLWAVPWIARELYFQARDEEARSLLEAAFASGFEHNAYWSIRVRRCVWSREQAAAAELLDELPVLNSFSRILRHLLEFTLDRSSMEKSTAVLAGLLELTTSPARKAFCHQLWAELWASVAPDAAAHQIRQASMLPTSDLRWVMACPAFRQLPQDSSLSSAIALVEERVARAFANDPSSEAETQLAGRSHSDQSTCVEIPTNLLRGRGK